jgi:hypothetical protein
VRALLDWTLPDARRTQDHPRTTTAPTGDRTA